MFLRDEMFSELERFVARPEAFAFYTTETLWNDPHISKAMLATHLDEDTELASRPKAVIDQSVKWMTSRFGIGPGKRICDLGCGPGLYTSRFARAGAEVTGVDFSERSIAHARVAAADEGLKIDYVQDNYLDFTVHGKFDLITLIFCDFCVLSPDQRKTLLGKMHGMLNEGGEILLDVVSLAYFETTPEKQSFEHCPDGGFWSVGPHYIFQKSFKYEAEKLLLDKYVIVETERSREIYNWLQCHDLTALTGEFEAEGLSSGETYADIAGAPYDESAAEYAIVARKIV